VNVFNLRNRLIDDYAQYVRSFIHIRDPRIRAYVEGELTEGLLWPEPLIQLNPSFASGEWIDELVGAGVLHEECRRVFRIKNDPKSEGKPLRLHRHQTEAVKAARTGANYVLTTGTGSGKSLAYIIPIVDHVLRHGSGRGIQAIVVYPMNALANSQEGELQKFLRHGYPDGRGPVTFARYTGQERDEERQRIIAHPPDILLTNYVMLELLLTRPHEKGLIRAAAGLRFLVLDELHTYRGRQGADVALLVRRTRDAAAAEHLQCVGTSATLAGSGAWEAQQAEVAWVASLLFGSSVDPKHVIGETLRRRTPDRDVADPGFLAELRCRVADPHVGPPGDYAGFVNDPLSVWIETTFGVTTDPTTGRLVRTRPRNLAGPGAAVQQLSTFTGVADDRCTQAIAQHLLASYRSAADPETGFPIFAFRLHQFISRGDMVYASPEPEAERHLTVRGQQFVPGDRRRVLLPLVFCRECGQDYYCVRMGRSDEKNGRVFSPRELADRLLGEDGEAGFLYLSSKDPWPSDPTEVVNRLPEDWLEEFRGSPRVRADRREHLPRAVRVGPDGVESENGVDCHYVPAPFRFCLGCGVAYGFRQTSDFAKLASLGTEGRSSATTVLSLAAIRYLRSAGDLPARARKLLSFTDNRQDASLQAGHFNDFVEIGLLRSALFKAVEAAGPDGLTHEVLVQRVFDALDLSLELYASDPAVRFQALEETKRALRSVLGYRLYRDLQRGWRVTSPNLEQCGVLDIRYLSLEELCRAEDVWAPLYPAMASARPETRVEVASTLLDFMRRELAIKVDYLEPAAQERIQQQSSQRLVAPWAIDENERMEHAAVLYARPVRAGDPGDNVYLSPRGGFGQYVRRPTTFPGLPRRLTLDDTQRICRDLLEALRVAGLVEVVALPRGEDDVPGYQLPASALLWVVGDGTRAFHDPIRVPRVPAVGARTNRFFIEFYRTIALEGKGLEAREHTAQVKYEQRQEREARFREGRLPILYCSPTMELGVDIAELNVVNLRNVPPTPANYAQRSGRAGRSGQPALVFAYCSTYSSHDQYFFHRPGDMVAGAVTPPRVDLANEDLVRSHVHAIWLAEAGLSLGSSLKDVLDVAGEEPTLELLPSVRDAIADEAAQQRARGHARGVLDTIREELHASDWYTEGWLDEVLAQVGRQFDLACERWRGLYRAAIRQRALQHKIVADASRSAEEKDKARRLRAEAEAQIDLLTATESAVEGDFYSYRYFASEGFLPGYAFPRLPLSAYIPGRRQRRGRDEFLSRPRFLAISEFGPRAILYHEGSRYRINKVILPVREDGETIVTTAAKQCGGCGYLHPAPDGTGPDLCERCGRSLDAPLAPLFRLQNVATKRADRINSDEEERLRLGFEIRTGVRFAEHGGRLARRTARAVLDGEELATLTYGPASTLWRINLGWRRRAQANQYGFVLDIERGYWQRNQQDPEDDDGDPLSVRTKRVIPYVEDRRNCLLVHPAGELSTPVLASLGAALKHAIQLEYQLEDSELAAEPLPSRDVRRLLLFYEAAEGGAGVLRRLVDDLEALARVSRRALELCHFDPDTGEDCRRAPRAREDCEAACYDCLRSYTNQQDHEILDRKRLPELLARLAHARVDAAPGLFPRAQHLAALLRQCQSGLERAWLEQIEGRGFRLPSRAQVFIEACRARPDFLYDEAQTVIYVDGPPHEYAERQARDRAQTACLEDRGYTVLRFADARSWDLLIARHPNLFGRPS
jgi:ATP-dependent helicase YprA (DUF1998 family)/very-short-patch-repair endonuclease